MSRARIVRVPVSFCRANGQETRQAACNVKLWLSLLFALMAILVVGRPAYAQSDLHVNDDSIDRPVLYMKFDETTGGVTFSYPTAPSSVAFSGGISGTLVAGATFTTTRPTAFTSPNFRALRLSATPQHVKIIESSSSTVLKTLTSQLTVTAWVKRTGFNSVDTIFANGSVSGNTNNNNWSLQFNSANQIALRSGQTTDSATTSVAVVDSNWHHIAATVGSGTAKIYLDGTLVLQQNPFLSPTTITGPSLVGARNEDNPNGQYLTGLIDELRVYSRALSDAEVARLAAGRGCAASGFNWDLAFFDLQCALDPVFANDGRTVRVATGIYRTGTNPLAAFNLLDGVQLLGGFVPTGPSSANRPPFPLQQLVSPVFPIAAGVSNLSGDLLANDFNTFNNDTDNAQAVLVATDDDSLLVDGFAIGGARVAGGLLAEGSSGTFSNLYVTLNRNITGDGGGGFSLIDTQAIIDRVGFQFNAAVNGGGGLSVMAGSIVTMTNAQVSGNTLGGGMRSEASTALLTNVQFTDNAANSGGGLNIARSNITFDDVLVADNVATAAGGVSVFSSLMNVISLTVTNNQAEIGGGMTITGAPMALDHTRILGNTALFTCQSVFSCGWGGGLFANSDLLTLGSDVVVSGNRGVLGGGIYVDSASALNASGSTISNNRVLTPTVIASPPPSPTGGGLVVGSNAAVTLTNVSLLRNQALDGCDNTTCTQGRAGGAFAASGASLVMSGGAVQENSATGDAGGIFASAATRVQLDGTLIEGNSARQGGGIYLIDTDGLLNNVLIRRNSSTGDNGGGATIEGSLTLTMTGGAFIENTLLDDEGGGIVFVGSPVATLDNVRFLGNIGSSQGGAVALIGSPFVTLRNTTMVGNTISATFDPTRGNAAFVTGGTLKLINATLVSNTGAGTTGLFADSGTLVVQNSLLRDNGAFQTAQGPQATVVALATSQSLPGPGADPLFVRNPTPGDGNWATFADNDYGDLHLRGPSPEVDAGDGTLLAGLATDFEGQPRVFDANYAANATTPPVDRGADEARFVGPTAAAGGPYSGSPGAPVALNATASSDDGPLASFRWDCTNDGSFEVTATAPTGSTCTYASAGAFTVRLVVTDSDGISATSTAPVTVSSGAPPAQSSIMLPMIFGP